MIRRQAAGDRLQENLRNKVSGCRKTFKTRSQATGDRLQENLRNKASGCRLQEIKTFKPEGLKTSKPETLNPSLETLNLKT